MKAVVLATLLTAPVLLSAQAAPDCMASGGAALSPSAFLECARTAAEKYQDRSKAIRDGYRPIGRDFPAMGEHWIRIALLFDGVVDPTRPEVLNYVVVDGKPKLVGLGFATPLLAGELAPELPAGRDAWHDHSKTIEDETVLPHPSPEHAHHGEEPGPRLAMLHTWLWAPNPDGVFAADNWSLAFVRLGFAVPASGSPEAAKALSLLTGGVDYFAELFAAEPRPIPRERAKIDQALREARQKVEAIVPVPRGADLSTELLSSLAAIWNDLLRVLNDPS